MEDMAWVIYLVYPCIVVVATILNSIALYVLYTRRPLRIMDTLLLHVFTSSFIYGVLRLIEILIKATQDIYTHYLVLESLIWFFGIVQLSMLTLIACQRFIAVYFPLRVRIWITKRRTNYVIYTTYVFLFLCSCILGILYWKGILGRRSSVGSYGILIIIDSVIMSILYISIFVKLALNKPDTQSNGQARKRKKLKSVLFSFTITLSNLVSYIPTVLHIFGLQYSQLYMFLLVWVDPIFNPVSYIILKRGRKIGETIRKWIRQLNEKCRHTKSTRDIKATFKRSMKNGKLDRDTNRDTIVIDISNETDEELFQ